MKLRFQDKFLLIFILAIGLACSHAYAQTSLSPNVFMAASWRKMNVMPDTGQGAGGEIIGYRGCVKCASKREAEIEALLGAPRKWFNFEYSGDATYLMATDLDDFARVLDAEDEQRYRDIFSAIAKGNLDAVPGLMEQLQNDVLVGHVEAAVLLHVGATPPDYNQLAEWLKKYADYPEAIDIYGKAAKLQSSQKVGYLQRVRARGAIGQGLQTDVGGTIEWHASGILDAMAETKEKNTFGKLLQRGKYDTALSWLDAQKRDGKLSARGEVASNLTLAEIYLRHGKGVEAWARIKDVDLGRMKFDEDSKHYALWLKGLCAWSAHDFASAYEAFGQLAEDSHLVEPNRAGAAFWAARAAEKLERMDDANRLYAIAASSTPRSFYGLMALAHSGSVPSYNWAQPQFTAQHATLLKSKPAGRRALALLQLDERVLAEAELQSFPLAGQDSLKPVLQALTQRVALPLLSLQIGRMGGLNNARTSIDVSLYPLMPWQPAGGYVSDPALVLAVARNESNFNEMAKSSAGAIGVMQIMPETAEVLREGASAHLFEPEANLTLGDRYLDILSRTDGIDNNLVLLIGAYNCGPKRLLDLLEASKTQNGDDPLLFVETLPIKETRDYIQKVMTSYWMYRARLNKPLTAMAEMTFGHWPQYIHDGAGVTMNTQQGE